MATEKVLVELDLSSVPDWPHPAKERLDEICAAKIVAAAQQASGETSVAVELWDHERGNKQVDYYVTFDSGCAAVEVSTIAIQQEITNLHHWRKRGPRSSNDAPRLRRSWIVVLDASAQNVAAKLRSCLTDWLYELETRGIDRYGPRFSVDPELVSRFSEVMAGVQCAWVAEGDPGFRVIHASGRHAFDPLEDIGVIVSRELREPKHVADTEKLEAAAADERHLFLWVDCSRWDIHMALFKEGPCSDPALPQSIDVIWLGFKNGDRTAALWWTREHGWAWLPVVS